MVVIFGSMAVVAVVLGALIVLRFMPYGGESGEWPVEVSTGENRALLTGGAPPTGHQRFPV